MWIYQLSCDVQTPEPQEKGRGEALEILDQPWLGARESFFPLCKLIFSYTVWLVYKEEETCSDRLHCEGGKESVYEWRCAAEPPQQVAG